MSDKYILEGKMPVAEDDLMKWMQTANCTVRKSTATICVNGEPVGEVRVSTVFLGLDYQFGEGPPLLFESMIFGGPLDQECDRCSTWEAAEKMHEKMMERVRLGAKDQVI